MSFSEMLDKRFKLTELGTNVSTEIIAGLTTFATMAYTLAVVPGMLAEAGLPKGAILTAMVLAVAATTIAMGLYTNRPFALAPGMGSVAVFAITMVQLQHVPVEIATGVVFISGVLFLLVTVFGIRDFITTIIPRGIKISVSAGIGLFLCVIGLRNAKLLAANAQKSALSFGDLTNPVVILAAIGFIILLVLEARKTRGAALIAILAATAIGIPMGITRLPSGIFSTPSGISEVAFHFDVLGALDVRYLPFLAAFFLPDFFSTLGTALGVGGKAGFLDKNGDLPGLDRVFTVDAVATTAGSFFTLPVMTTYLESGAGVEAGGRSGLTAITTACVFLLVLFITPLALMIPAAATAPVLVYAGINMLGGLRNLDFSDQTESVPAYLCIALTVFTFNVANGIAAGFIAYVILKAASGRIRELHWGHYALAALFFVYFYSISAIK